MRLIEMAQKNAENTFLVSRVHEVDFARTLDSLKETLKLKQCRNVSSALISPIYLESRLWGLWSPLNRGKPNKSRYKRFKIKTVGQIDDYAMMYEVLTRRCKKGSGRR